MKPSKKMIIYNLFPLLAGPFTKWEKHLRRASEMGFNWVFVNPIQKTGRSNSLYSIADYFRFNPLLADKTSKQTKADQVKAANDRAEKLGLKMMIDLVINHCAADSALIKKHREWFLLDEKGKIVHPSCNENGQKIVWKDLAKFDYKHSKDQEGLYNFIFSVVKSLIDLGFKGFRCDAAYQVPAKLWHRLIDDTRRICPDVLFIAETLGCTPEKTKQTADAGFDYIFNSSKWWDFNSNWLMKQYNLTREISPSISFPESHDTLRLCEELQGNIKGLKQRYLFSALFSAGVMMPLGFEFGARKKPHVVETRASDWEETEIDLTDYIKAVNSLKGDHSIFQEEAPTEILHTDNSNILIIWKGSIDNQEEALIVINKDIYNSQHFYTESLQKYMEAGTPLVDISPEQQLEYIPEPFTYDLHPGQGFVFVTTKEAIPED